MGLMSLPGEGSGGGFQAPLVYDDYCGEFGAGFDCL